MIWSEDTIQRMRGLAEQRYTARQISEELGCSRNAVIGKCRRIGILLLAFNTGRARAKRGPYIKTRGASNFMLKAPAMPNQHRERASLLPGSIMPCDIFHLDETTCRWPLWGMRRPELKDQFYCGDVTAPNSVWCEVHLKVSLRQPMPARGTNYSGRKSVLVT